MSYIAERRQEEKERRRAEIIDAAEAVAATVGWDAMTMDRVARKARRMHPRRPVQRVYLQAGIISQNKSPRSPRQVTRRG